MYSFLFLEHIREFFEHDGILGSQSQFITQRIRDAAPFLNAHVLSALRMGECTARDLCTVRQGLLSDVTRTAERAKLDRHALHIRNWVIDERFAHDHTHHTSYSVGMRIKIRILRFVWYDIGLEFHEDGCTRAHAGTDRRNSGGLLSERILHT